MSTELKVQVFDMVLEQREVSLPAFCFDCDATLAAEGVTEVSALTGVRVAGKVTEDGFQGDGYTCWENGTYRPTAYACGACGAILVAGNVAVKLLEQPVTP